MSERYLSAVFADSVYLHTQRSRWTPTPSANDALSLCQPLVFSGTRPYRRSSFGVLFLTHSHNVRIDPIPVHTPEF